MKLSAASQSVIESAIKKATNKFICGDEQCIVTDIHLQPLIGAGELIIFDDEDVQLASANVQEWVDCDPEEFNEGIESLLCSLLKKMQDEGCFEHVSIMKPYSFVMVDEDKESVSDLLLMDDDTLLVNNELLKGLDEELDSFLKELLEK